MGVAGDIFVTSRRRCENIDFRLAPRSRRQDPSALVPIWVVQVTRRVIALLKVRVYLDFDNLALLFLKDTIVTQAATLTLKTYEARDKTRKEKTDGEVQERLP